MKIKITSTLPTVKIPAKASIIIYLLREEIKNRRFIICFEKAGVDASINEIDLGSLILSVAGFEERSDALFAWYIERLDHYAAKASVSDNADLHDHAFSFYVDLEIEKRSLKLFKKRNESFAQ